MRGLLLLVASIAVALPTARAQSSAPELPRWELGPSVLAGAGLLLGGSLSFRAVQTSRLSIAAEVSGFAPLVEQLEWACLNSSGCRNGAPAPQARGLASVGLRATIPVAHRWYAAGDAAFVAGHWRYPVAGTHRALGGGLAIGHRSRSERRAVEVRWQRIGTGDAPVSTWRVGWLHSW